MSDGDVARGDPVLDDVGRPGDDAAGFKRGAEGYVVLNVAEDAVAGTDDAGAETGAGAVGGADETFGFGFGAGVFVFMSAKLRHWCLESGLG